MFQSIFGGPKPAAQSPVQGTLVNFYPLSTHVVQRVGSFFQPIIKGFVMLIPPGPTQSSDVSSVKSAAGEQTSVRNVPINGEQIKALMDLREKAVTFIMDGISNPQFANALAEVILCSMRDQFPKPSYTAPEKQKLLEEMPLEALVEILNGIAEANKSVLAPFRVRERAATPEVPEAAPLRAVPPSDPQTPTSSTETSTTP